jgi:very-short-patch-repair endonuclease
MRKSMTRQEFKLWRHLRELRQLGFHFRRQAPIKNFIVDFACYHPRVIVELDGSQHSQERHSLRDKSRNAKLEADGFTIMAFGTTRSIQTWRVSSIEYFTC